MKHALVAASLLVACSDVSLGSIRKPAADDGGGGAGGHETTSSTGGAGGTGGGGEAMPTLDDCPDLRATLISRGGGLYELPPTPAELVNVFANSPAEVNVFVTGGEERVVPHVGDDNGCSLPPVGGWYVGGPSLVAMCPEIELSPAEVITMAARCTRYDK